jgi:AhpD family alkylhydroperoxidase
VRAVYDDIMATRKTDWINNFWKAIAHDPVMLKRTWEDIKQIMAPGALDPLTKEMIYVAVSVTNQCEYCIASHTASAKNKGMTDAQFKELMSVVGMANETNRLVAGYQVEVDDRFKTANGQMTSNAASNSSACGERFPETIPGHACRQSYNRLRVG